MTDNLTFNISPDEIELFLEDVNECLATMESGILQLEQIHDPEVVNSIFRAAHTLKAVAGAVGHRQMAELTHTVETLFDAMRETKLSVNQAVADELLVVIDVLKKLRDEIVNQQPGNVDIAPLLSRLRTLPVGAEKQEQRPVPATPAAGRITPAQMAQLNESYEAGQNLLEIEILAEAESFAPAARLYQAALALMEAGQIIAQQPALDALAEGEQRLWLILATEQEPTEIETVLADVTDLAEFQVQPYVPASSSPQDRALSRKEKEVSSTADPMISKNQGMTHGIAGGTVRISTERLDTLMDLVGELVTNRTRLLQIENMLRTQYGKDSNVAALSEMVPHFSHVVDQLQEEVMRARMLPIASLFNKMPRLVRDVARKAGKQVDLNIEGETTELDRAVIEAIGDPLIHLLRNAVDHGIETPEARQSAGKAATGVIRLAAASMEGQIVITVSDDGWGIDPDRIYQAASGRGLLPESSGEASQLSEDEIIDLIFQPNLSTATEVTEMSGRGVGLDVVRTNIERLSGSVVVMSKPGQGTTFELTLPLTLALVQTMLVSVHNTLYAVPVTGINGAMYLAEAPLSTVKGKPTLDWQGTTVPLLDLREYFARSHLITEQSGPNGRNGLKPSVVLVNWGKHQVGLAVDKIIGQQEIVVKSLSPLMGRPVGVSGATILGDGQVALIVDIPGLINAAMQLRRQRER